MDRPVQQRIEALDPEKEERTQYPSAAIQRGIDHEWKNLEEHEVCGRAFLIDGSSIS